MLGLRAPGQYDWYKTNTAQQETCEQDIKNIKHELFVTLLQCLQKICTVDGLAIPCIKARVHCTHCMTILPLETRTSKARGTFKPT